MLACDALIPAAGLEDLGSNFGSGEPAWSGASGVALLGETARRLVVAGYGIGNVAVQLVGTRPRLAGRRDEAQAVLSDVCGAPVRLSATTTDA
jgi:2-C-methyl-D-erythritol 2,4-cyclodiphosphate synthase